MNSNATPKAPAEFVTTMLRSSIEADLLVAEYINDAPLRQAEQQAAVNGLIAGVALENLHRFAPDAAKAVSQTLDSILTAGDVGGPAYRAAKKLGNDPDQWIAAFNERANLRKEKARQADDQSALFERTVARHITDGLTSGDQKAADLARSLITELEAAGIHLDIKAGA
ncbi:hypothetical protein OG552_10240 [Streptomyces sp. NBC_01476]|uniref:hypothetical protein n=1 Tax=Streptomyces sp. NBC_01476 TaxID=2903881 RepID=UPI002E3016D5|nr:hypothetical protein [Streptomyces sp. NBC_01476]